MGSVITHLGWMEIGHLRPNRAARPMIPFEPATGDEVPEAAIYRLDFLGIDGRHAPAGDHGEDCYIGQTTNLSRRIEEYRYGRGGGHGAAMKVRALVHGDRHPGGPIRVSIAAIARIEAAGQEVRADALGAHGRLLLEHAAVVEARVEGRRLFNDDADARRLLARRPVAD